jgi:hypothetical protein
MAAVSFAVSADVVSALNVLTIKVKLDALALLFHYFLSHWLTLLSPILPAKH